MEPASVVIATYNRAGLLPATLASVVVALRDDDEIVIADDGSTDDTADLFDTASAPWHGRVRYLALPWGGAGRAFNAGIAAARHDLIAFADSDDLWLPYRLELGRTVLVSEPTLAYCFSNFAQLTADGQLIPRWLVQWSGDPRTWDEILAPGFPYAGRWPLPDSLPPADASFRVHVGSMYRRQLHQNYMCVNTLLVRRSCVGDALRFGVDLPRLADWECYARISRVGDGAYLDVDTAVQRSHAGVRLSKQGPFLGAQSRLAIIERTWAQDAAFMNAHGDEVRDLLPSTRRLLVRHLMLRNRRSEARAILDGSDGMTLERLALLLPHSMLTKLHRLFGHKT